MASQISRAASSIPANIAEGGSRSSQKEYARYIQIALGSAFELETFILGIKMIQMIDEDLQPILDLITEEQKMLSVFLKKLKADC